MLSRKKRLQITEFAKLRYKDKDRFHRMKHIRKVAFWAMKLSAIEKSDREICWIAAMLHDIAKGEGGDHAINGANEAKAFLLLMGIDKKTVDGVYDAIYFHNKDFKGGSIERRVLWDADKLDVLTLDGFKNRLCPNSKEEKGEKNFVKNSEEEVPTLLKNEYILKKACTS